MINIEKEFGTFNGSPVTKKMTDEIFAIKEALKEAFLATVIKGQRKISEVALVSEISLISFMEEMASFISNMTSNPKDEVIMLFQHHLTMMASLEAGKKEPRNDKN